MATSRAASGAATSRALCTPTSCATNSAARCAITVGSVAGSRGSGSPADHAAVAVIGGTAGSVVWPGVIAALAASIVGATDAGTVTLAGPVVIGTIGAV